MIDETKLFELVKKAVREEIGVTEDGLKLLKMADLEVKLMVCKQTIYRYIKNQGFPKPKKFTEKKSAWLEPEVDEWILSRPISKNIN